MAQLLQSPEEKAAVARITSHMNKDHQDSIRRYLEHHAHMSAFAARNATIKDLNLDSMEVSNGTTKTFIPFDPPMKSLRESRERLVQMDRDSLAALRRSDITVTEYHPPSGFALVVFITCIVTFISFSRKANFFPGSFLYERALKYTPELFVRFCIAVQPIIFWLMTIIHSTEAYFMMKRLERHSVFWFQGIWWEWVFSNFVEGFTAQQRFEAIVREKTAEKEKRQH